jgi:hypothetical protein
VIDVEHNAIGDHAFSFLVESLRVNKSLKCIKVRQFIYYSLTKQIDYNNITVAGFGSLRQGLQFNKTLQFIPFPKKDVATAGRTNTIKAFLQDIFFDIEFILRQNRGATGMYPLSSQDRYVPPPTTVDFISSQPSAPIQVMDKL